MRIWMLVPLVVLTGCSTLGLKQQTQAKADRNEAGMFWRKHAVARKTAIMAEGSPGDAAKAALPWVSLVLGGGGVGVGLLALKWRKKIMGIVKVMVSVIQQQKDADKLTGDDIRKTVGSSSVRPDEYDKIVAAAKLK